MAVMIDADRLETWAEFMRELSAERDPLPLTKADLRAAVNALDLFLSDNAASLNSAIPQPARGALTVSQKARLLMFVVRKRYIKGV